MSTLTPLPPTEAEYQPPDEARHERYLTPERRRDRRLVTGTILVLFGIVMLIETLTNWELLGALVVPTLGIAFAFWGSLTRRAGLIIPGGILLGVGTGTLLVQQGWVPANGDYQAAAILLGLSLGFAVITPLTWAFTERMHWWNLIPGSVLALVGFGLLAGSWGAVVLEWLGRLWPAAVIIVGVILLWNVARKR